MGKLVGIAGTLRGKVGAMVFSKGRHGESIAKSYQPVVANPRTEAQLKQRSKMTLVGKMSSVVPDSAIQGLGKGSKKDRRSEFARRLLSVVSVDTSDFGVFAAMVDPSDIVFGIGSIPLKGSVSQQLSITSTSATIGVTGLDSVEANKYGEKVILVVVKPEDKGGLSFVMERNVIVEDGVETTVTFEFGEPLESQTMVAVYRVPFELSDEAASLVASDLANNGAEILSSLMSADGGVKSWGKSVMSKMTVFSQA